jgi:hypothetical protein
MRRSVSKIRNIQEMNRMLEKRMLNESNSLNKKTLIKEDRERFTLSEFVDSPDSPSTGTYKVENGSLILTDKNDFEYQITCN